MPDATPVVPIVPVRRSSHRVKPKLDVPNEQKPSSSHLSLNVPAKPFSVVVATPDNIPTTSTIPGDSPIPPISRTPAGPHSPQPTEVPPGSAAPTSSLLMINALVNILHTILNNQHVYFQYALAIDQALCYAIHHLFNNFAHV